MWDTLLVGQLNDPLKEIPVIMQAEMENVTDASDAICEKYFEGG